MKSKISRVGWKASVLTAAALLVLVTPNQSPAALRQGSPTADDQARPRNDQTRQRQPPEADQPRPPREPDQARPRTPPDADDQRRRTEPDRPDQARPRPDEARPRQPDDEDGAVRRPPGRAPAQGPPVIVINRDDHRPYAWWPYWYGYPWHPFPPSWRYPGRTLASIRLQITPRHAEVYVNGYFAGVADDFDGIFQRLRLEPGEYDIVCYASRYQTWAQRLYVLPGRDYHFRHVMRPLGPNEPDDPRPMAVPFPQLPPEMPPPSTGGQVEPGGFGTLSIQVQPSDAEVLVDGQPWQRSDEQASLMLYVAEGMHVIEVRKPGYQPFSAQILVRRGETTPLNVSLSPTE